MRGSHATSSIDRRSVVIMAEPSLFNSAISESSSEQSDSLHASTDGSRANLKESASSPDSRGPSLQIEQQDASVSSSVFFVPEDSVVQPTTEKLPFIRHKNPQQPEANLTNLPRTDPDQTQQGSAANISKAIPAKSPSSLSANELPKPKNENKPSNSSNLWIASIAIGAVAVIGLVLFRKRFA